MNQQKLRTPRKVYVIECVEPKYDTKIRMEMSAPAFALLNPDERDGVEKMILAFAYVLRWCVETRILGARSFARTRRLLSVTLHSANTFIDKALDPATNDYDASKKN